MKKVSNYVFVLFLSCAAVAPCNGQRGLESFMGSVLERQSTAREVPNYVMVDNALFQLDSIVNRDADSVCTKKTFYDYSLMNGSVTYYDYTYDNTSYSWVNSTKIVVSLTPEGANDEKLYHAWNASSAQWEVKHRTTYFYDSQGDTLLLDTLRAADGVWCPYMRTITTKHTNGRYNLEEFQQYNGSGVDYRNYVKYEYQFDTRDNIKWVKMYPWVQGPGGGWRDYNIYTSLSYLYDTQDNVIDMINTNFYVEQVQSMTKTIFDYNNSLNATTRYAEEMNLRTTHQVVRGVNFSLINNVWIKEGEQRLYYSAISNTQVAENGIHPLEVYVHDGKLILPDEMAINIFDLSGRCVYVGTTSVVDGLLPGVYILRSRQGTTKVLIP